MKENPNVLVTCGRFYPTIELVRALHGAGARVDACDPYKLAAALHSNAVDQTHVVPSPAKDTTRFVKSVVEIVQTRHIDLVVPGFEDGYYLSHYRDAIPAQIFAPVFGTIEQLHDKARFHDACVALNLPTPPTETITNREQMRAAIEGFGDFVARPAFSRGGATCFTNHGPRAAEMTVDDVNPSPVNPYLLQPFIKGRDACSFSIVRDGEILVHCVYEPSVAATGGFAVQFSAIEDFGTLEAASKVASKFEYTGFLGLDYRRTDGGFVMIECNPRLTAGIFLTPGAWTGEAVVSTKNGGLSLAPAGKRLQYDASLLIANSTQLSARQRLHELLSAPDAILSHRDILPGLFCFLNRRHWSHAAEEHHTSLADELLSDIVWDGTSLPEFPG